MGHTRIGRLNRTRKWKDVVACFCLGAGTEQITIAALEAAKSGFNYDRISSNTAYHKAVELLVHLGVAGQSGDFAGSMRRFGIQLSSHPTLQELNARLSEAVDEAAWNGRSPKDEISEFAKKALCKAVSICCKKEQADDLPNIPRTDLSVFDRFGDKVNFADLNQMFVSNVVSGALKSYLSQIIPNLLGVEQRVMSTHELLAAYNALDEHIYETAIVHRKYSIDWLKKHNNQLGSMTPRDIRNHANFIISKMLRALKYGKD